MVERMPQNGTNGWAMSDLHVLSTTATTADVKQNIYAQWAGSYDEEVLAHEYVGPGTTAGKAVEILQGHFGECGRIALLDAGCGTGLLGKELQARVQDMGFKIRLVGVDFSAEMLLEAKKKRMYDELWCADLNYELPVAERSIEIIASCGVFLDGHCGPRAFGNLLRYLKEGGFLVAALRKSTFIEEGEEFLRMVKVHGCELVTNDIGPYLGPVVAHFLTIRKLAMP